MDDAGTELDLEQEIHNAEVRDLEDFAMATAAVQEAAAIARDSRSDLRRQAVALRAIEDLLPVAQEILERHYRRAMRAGG